MPTYVYKFVDTGETIEVQQAFTDDTLTECVHPQSGTTMAVKKVFQPVGVTFKGDGFYKTDSRGGGTTKRSRESADSSTSDTSSSDTSSSGTSSSGTSSSGTSSSGSSSNGSTDTGSSGATSGDSSSSSSSTSDSGSKKTSPSADT